MIDKGGALYTLGQSGSLSWKRGWPKAWRSLLLSALLAGSDGALMAANKEAWVEVRSPHFIAYCDAGEAEARRTLEGFEAIRGVFTFLMPGLQVDLHKPTVILVTANERSMSRFVPSPFEGKDPTRPAGLFNQGWERNYVLLRLDVSHQDDQPYFVVFHEYTHQVMHQNFPGLPTWLDEGIADYYGTTELHQKNIYLGRIPLGRRETLQHGRMPLKDLLTVTHDSPHYQEGSKAGVFYAQSWALTHYLLMDPEAKKAGLFQSYLRTLAHAQDPLAAAQEGFGDLKKLEGTLGSYAMQSRYHFGILPLKVQLSDKDFVTRTLNEAEALVLRAEYLLQRDEKAAQTLLEQARSLAPGNPEVQTGWGLLCERLGRYDEARAAFQAALDLGSQDFRPALHLAQMAQSHHLAQPPTSAQVLAWLEAAKHLRPDFPGLHMALCWEYSDDPKTAQRAIEEGIEAAKLDPRDLAIRMNLGSVLMRLDQPEAATRIWEQLTQLAQTAADREHIAPYKAQLDDFLAHRVPVVVGLSPSVVARAPEPPGRRSLKFSLPSNWTDLGREVQRLVGLGELDAAIRKVEQALPRAGSAYEKKTLNALLAQLRERKANKPPAS